ncbi:MAG TPA: hypothetical protein VMT02_00405 [Burkholderiales bacterium]|jgi:hypothetical protein|nr:hypothetical protein [Burkholderiales bacterium]
MRPAAFALLCVLPVGGCLRDPQADAAAPGARDLARFEQVARETARERAHTAVALAADPERIFWGTAVAAPTRERARALAIARCTMRARLSHASAPCSVYSIDGRPLYLDAN